MGAKVETKEKSFSAEIGFKLTSLRGEEPECHLVKNICNNGGVHFYSSNRGTLRLGSMTAVLNYTKK